MQTRRMVSGGGDGRADMVAEGPRKMTGRGKKGDEMMQKTDYPTQLFLRVAPSRPSSQYIILYLAQSSTNLSRVTNISDDASQTFL